MVLERSEPGVAEREATDQGEIVICGSCSRTEDEPHTSDCIVALEQDAGDGDRDAAAELRATGHRSNDSASPDLSDLPVFVAEPNEIVSDRRGKAFATDQTMYVIARTDDNAVVGRTGIGMYAVVAPEAFAGNDKVLAGGCFRIERTRDGDAAELLGVDQHLASTRLQTLDIER
jgi:hypothetical protein